MICHQLALADELPKNIGLLPCDMLIALTIDKFRLSFILLHGEFGLDHKCRSWEELILIAD